MDFNLHAFLEKFKNITPPDDFLKKTLIAIVKEEIGIEIQRKDINVKHGTVYLSLPHSVKSELYIKKPFLLKRLSDFGFQNQISDIR